MKNGMESRMVFVLILAIISYETAPVHSLSIHASANPLPVGSDVTLFSHAEVTLGAWIFNNEIIAMIAGGKTFIFDSWTNRVTLNLSTNYTSLTIRSLKVEDSGLYTLQKMNTSRADLKLSVQVPVSNVTLRAQKTNLVEFNDTAVLMCSVSSGTSLSYAWLKGSSVVTAGDGIQLSNEGATLTIVGVTRYDAGPFMCNVSNGVSHETSPPVHLNISYGPSNTMISLMPMKYIYRTGSNITLHCSSESSPPAMIQWMLDGVYLNQFAPQLQLEKTTESNSGNYQCILHNTVTSRFSSTSAIIRILDPIEAVVVNHTGGPAILNDSFTMCCEVTGSVDSIQWWRNGQLIPPDNSTVFDMGNKTLTLSPVQHSDQGDYQCQAFNYVSNMTSSPYTVDVIYGPEMTIITGPKMAKTGCNVTLSCNASSNPLSIKWFFNDTVVATMPEYVTPPLTEDMSGMYTCMAYNNITGKNSTAYTMLTVIDPITDVQIDSPMDPAMDGHYYNLTCNVTGPAMHVYWIKNGEPLREDNRTVFCIDNKTVMFNPLEQDDTGNYQCMALNAVSDMTSPPYKLLVNFGPETPIIDGPAFAETGHVAVFHCSAKSVPPSQFSWWFNGSEVASTAEFTTGLLHLNMSGEYTCMAYNSVTGMNSTNTKMLTVIEAIESVMVRAHSVPVNSENFTLTCEVTGPYDKIYWMKNNMYLNMNTSNAKENMSYYMENNMLHFTPVTMYNDGNYQCVATNQAATHQSPPYMLLVNYGPLSMHISGPDSAEYGHLVSLSCSADSQPDCDFSWFFSSNSLILVTGPVITFPAVKQNEGNYTCKARNPVTNVMMYQTKYFTVENHASALRISSQGALMLISLLALSVTVLFN
uniref:carcinoembryonic antigen-related cell adhesion molecule 1 n=1 Tax=Scatophagus argus TaxID=75038 RepID=UPI001ED809CA|nr:carcinoembryonic antigen-related cell adhesion molecule 1 [Scatophagus argus]